MGNGDLHQLQVGSPLDKIRRMLPDIDSLALFVRAAEMLNLTRAAEASLITVPAASRRLSLLEHQFKAQLFERHSRGMDLTPAGERLLQLAREVMASVHHLRAEMGNYARGRQTVLRVHGNTSAMTQFLPGDIASFQESHENVRIVLEECWSEEAVRPRAPRRNRSRRDPRRPGHERAMGVPVSLRSPRCCEPTTRTAATSSLSST